MLKNKNNGKLYLKATLNHMAASMLPDIDGMKQMGRILRFIENCPLKIVKINVEAF